MQNLNTYQLFVFPLVLAGLLFGGFIRVLPTAGLIHFGSELVPLQKKTERDLLKSWQTSPAGF